MHDKQDVRVSRHSIQHRSKLGQLHLERVELLTHACARVLQRLDQLARALVAGRAEVVLDLLRAAVVGWGGGGDDEKGRPFEQDRLGGAAGLGESRQVFGEDGRVRDDGVYDARPCLRLVSPDSGRV